MLATNLLEKQHRKLEAILAKLEKRSRDTRGLLTELANDLAAHMAIEQELFYPAIQDLDYAQILESYEAHAIAELALKRLLATDPQSDEFVARVATLKELIAHHVKEEEEEIFPQSESALDEARLNDLGDQMQVMFDQLVKAGFAAVIPGGYAKTSSDLSKNALKKSPSERTTAA